MTAGVAANYLSKVVSVANLVTGTVVCRIGCNLADHCILGKNFAFVGHNLVGYCILFRASSVGTVHYTATGAVVEVDFGSDSLNCNPVGEVACFVPEKAAVTASGMDSGPFEWGSGLVGDTAVAVATGPTA